MDLLKKSIGYLSFLFFLFTVSIPLVQATPRFVDNGDNTITDTSSGLMWLKKTPSPIATPAVTWNEAIRLCEKLRIGGYNNWRLPFREEWATIIDSNNQFPALVEPNPFENVIVNSPYWTGSEHTFGPDFTCDFSGCPLKSHVVLLYLGYVGHQNKSGKAFVWPLRSTVTDVGSLESIEKERITEEDLKKKLIIKPFVRKKGFSNALVQPELLSKEFQLWEVEKKEQAFLNPYLRIPIKKNSKAVLSSKEGDIEVAILIYQMDQRRVDLFNNSAGMFDLPVRLRLDPEKDALVFFAQP